MSDARGGADKLATLRTIGVEVNADERAAHRGTIARRKDAALFRRDAEPQFDARFRRSHSDTRRQREKPPPQPCSKRPLKKRGVHWMLGERLRNRERMLGVVAEHPAPEDESHPPVAIPSASDSLRLQAFRRQPERIADSGAEQSAVNGAFKNGSFFVHTTTLCGSAVARFAKSSSVPPCK